MKAYFEEVKWYPFIALFTYFKVSSKSSFNNVLFVLQNPFKEPCKGHVQSQTSTIDKVIFKAIFIGSHGSKDNLQGSLLSFEIMDRTLDKL